MKEWLRDPSTMSDHLKCLQKIMDEKVHSVFTVCDDENGSSLRIHYLASELFSVCHGEEIDAIVPKKLLQETIALPLEYEQSNALRDELNKLADEKRRKGDVSVTIVNDQSRRKRKRREVVLFGYYRTVVRLKQEFLKMMEKYRLFTFQLQSFSPLQVSCQFSYE